MVGNESFGFTFLNDSGANDAQMLYLKRFGGPPDGKDHFESFFVGIDPCGNH